PIDAESNNESNCSSDGFLSSFSLNHCVKTAEDVNGIANASRIASKILTCTERLIEVGVSGEQIDDYVYQLCLSNRCYPSPLNYKGFPKCVTLSVNNVAVHGIPDKRKLVNGDIITVDVTVFCDGYHGDTAKTFIVGNGDNDARHLIKTSRQCLEEAIRVCRDGVPFSIIGKSIESTAKRNGLNVIPAICGHGIGRQFHEPPQIIHFDCENESDCNEMREIMRENMVFTIEPALSEGEVDIEVLGDGWTVTTCDNSRTAQFEHTICVKKNGAQILSTDLWSN
ncbi:methionine aminopeptidase 1D-like protein, partial [Dinothrombium tinctorium]